MKKALLIVLAVLLAMGAFATVALAQPEDFVIIMLEDENTDVIRIQMRLRDLGYITYRATGRYYGLTEKAVLDFQKNNDLDADGRCGEQTYTKMFETGVVRKPLSAEQPVTSGPALVGSPAEYGELGDWAQIDAAFPVGATAVVKDFNSGKSFEMQRTGGTGHADVEPVDEAAYEEYINSFGGKPNWEKRSALVVIDGTTYAASMFGNQHGEDTIEENGMDGHTCLYFYNSTSDALGFVDKEHQIFVLAAAGEL